MTDQQMQVIVSLIGGLEMAIVHLANTMADQTGLSRERVAKSFEDSAAKLGPDVVNAQMLQLVLRQVAGGIRTTSAGAIPPTLASRLLQ